MSFLCFCTDWEERNWKHFILDYLLKYICIANRLWQSLGRFMGSNYKKWGLLSLGCPWCGTDLLHVRHLTGHSALPQDGDGRRYRQLIWRRSLVSSFFSLVCAHLDHDSFSLKRQTFSARICWNLSASMYLYVCGWVFTRGALSLKSCYDIEVRAIWPSSFWMTLRSTMQFANKMAYILEQLL